MSVGLPENDSASPQMSWRREGRSGHLYLDRCLSESDLDNITVAKIKVNSFGLCKS